MRAPRYRLSMNRRPSPLIVRPGVRVEAMCSFFHAGRSIPSAVACEARKVNDFVKPKGRGFQVCRRASPSNREVVAVA
jgi:hypothetical protein